MYYSGYHYIKSRVVEIRDLEVLFNNKLNFYSHNVKIVNDGLRNFRFISIKKILLFKCLPHWFAQSLNMDVLSGIQLEKIRLTKLTSCKTHF